MRYSRLKKIEGLKELIGSFSNLDDYLYFLGIKKENRGNRIILNDTRTFLKEGICHIEPLFIDKKLVYIVCPFCGDVHVHGSSTLGYRVAHCENTLSKEEYYILDRKKAFNTGGFF